MSLNRWDNLVGSSLLSCATCSGHGSAQHPLQYGRSREWTHKVSSSQQLLSLFLGRDISTLLAKVDEMAQRDGL